MRKDILEREHEIQQWVNELRPKAFICRELNCKPETLEFYLHKLNIDYRGNQGRKGNNTGKKVDALRSSPFLGSHKLKLKLLRDGYKSALCESCGTSMWWVRRDLMTWEYVQVPLELHHIDGDHTNNDLSNLLLLCPNCHSLTNTNSGKNANHHAPVAETV